jgi:hypothetical protein
MFQAYQAAPPPASQQAFSAESFQLAASYGLGQPQAQYSRASTGCLMIAISSFVGLLTLAVISLFVVTSVMSIQLSGFSPFTVLIPVFIFAFLVILGFLLRGFWLQKDCAYECSEGFIELHGNRAVRVMRWDQIQRVWKQVKITHRPNGGTTKTIFYYIADSQGQTHAVSYLHIWKRANYEHARREFAQFAPQMLTDFNAGQYLLFGQLSVDQHGVSIPGSMTYRSQSYQFPLPAIIKASLGQRLTFEIASVGGVQTVSATIPEQATRLLLLLQILSQGRILCEYDDWLIR